MHGSKVSPKQLSDAVRSDGFPELMYSCDQITPGMVVD